MNILFRTDASVAIGTGHVMRCLTLANELRNRGNNCEFICGKLPGNLIELIDQSEFKVYEIASGDRGKEIDRFITILKMFPNDKPDWLIIDHYNYNEIQEKKLRPIVKKIMVIDDLANRRHDCDLLLDQNYPKNTEKYNGLVTKDSKQLLGPEYALLRKEFQLAREKNTSRDGVVKKILVFLGGSDPENVTQKVIDALILLDYNGLEIDVVIGSSNPHIAEIEKKIKSLSNASLSIQVSDMSRRMQEADLFLGSGGSITWERMCLGLPGMIIVVADNQQDIANALAKDNLIINLGWHKNLRAHDIKAAIEKLLASPEKLKTMSHESMKLVDGLGAQRVVEKMMGLIAG